MNINVAPEIAGTVSYSPNVPETFREFIIPNADCSMLSGDFGYCLLQERKGSQQSLRVMNTCLQQQSDKLVISVDPNSVILLVSLQNSFYCNIPSMGDHLFHEQSCNLLYVPSGNITVHGYNHLPGSLVALHYPEAQLLQLAGYYPLLETFLENIRDREASWLDISNRLATRKMMEQLEELQYRTYRPELFSIYLQAKGTELLLAALDEFSIEPDPAYKAVKLSKWDTDQLYSLKQWLAENSDEPGSMQDITRRAGMNNFKLKRGFRQLFGTSIFGFVLKVRMKKALWLLQQSEQSVSDISMMLGYKSLFNFIRAFKKYYGNSPGAYRKE